MGSSFYNSINPSIALLSRAQFPALQPKDSSVEFFQFLHHYNGCCSYYRKRENGHFKMMKRKARAAEVRKWRVSVSLAESVAAKADVEIPKHPPEKKLKVLVAGGGIGGLVFALAAKRKGFEVVVFEKDLSAIRGEGQYRGPIQIQSNALAALEAIDMDVAEEIMSAGCITGDRINGLVDGISGKWYIKFDTFTPAVERGLPVTRVISRITLQQIVARAVGEEIIMNESNVVNFEDDGNKVGRTHSSKSFFLASQKSSKRVNKFPVLLYFLLETFGAKLYCFYDLVNFEDDGNKVGRTHSGKSFFLASQKSSKRVNKFPAFLDFLHETISAKLYCFYDLSYIEVTVILENGQRHEGDILIGADGIWSKVRTNLFGYIDAIYSDYTCYTGIADYVPADIDTVGYRVFLGHKQYFVSSDVGGGKMQWYAFHKELPGGVDSPNGKKERLLQIFEGWCDNVIDLLLATDEDAILRRDIYDRIPSFSWGRGRVTLLGDSIHAMQPNLGQGGCMAIEDSYQLALELDKSCSESIRSGRPFDVVSSLKRYENARKLRVAVIHGLARMAAIMASTYKSYLGVGLGPLSFLTKFRIPHPGRVGGRVFIDIGMPLMLSWVLGGNGSKLEGRPLHCRLSDKANDELQKWFEDDDALVRALEAEWFLFPIGQVSSDSEAVFLCRDEKNPCTVGNAANADTTGVLIAISSPQVSKLHAEISYKDGLFFLTDLCSEYGTWIIDNEGRRHRLSPNSPTRCHPSDVIEFGSDKAAFRVKVMKNLAQPMAKNQEKEILSVS